MDKNRIRAKRMMEITDVTADKAAVTVPQSVCKNRIITADNNVPTKNISVKLIWTYSQ